MNHTLIHLNEQKYMGISTKIYFREHNTIDFKRLQQDVARAGIVNIDPGERFVSMDSNFQTDSFRYTPLVPVTAFEGDAFTRYTRPEGDYYCFEVSLLELGPQWFQECYVYMERNRLHIDHTFDLEYYPKDYLTALTSDGFRLQDQTISLLFRKVDAGKDDEPELEFLEESI